MLTLHGAHGEDTAHEANAPGRPNGHWSKAPAFEHDPERAARLHAATEGDRQRYLTSGLQEVDCRFCHGSVMVKKLGVNHTAVQWNTAATDKCAFFAQMREEGTNTARIRGCPRLSDSIAHAIAEDAWIRSARRPRPETVELQLQQHGNRPVIDQFNSHVRAEHPGLDPRAELAQCVGERLHDGLGDTARCCRIPGGTAPLLGVGVQRELTDHQDGGTHVRRGLLIIENAKLPHLLRELCGLFGIVVMSDAHQGQ